MKRHSALSTLLAATIGLAAAQASAAVVDWSRTIQGDVLQGAGVHVGEYTATFVYNTNPIDLKRLPNTPGMAVYQPWPLYADKFFINLSVTLFNDVVFVPDPNGVKALKGTYTSFNRPVTEMQVVNDFEFNAFNPDDAFRIIGSDFSFAFRSDDASVLSSDSIQDILTGLSDGIFRAGNGLGVLSASYAGVPGYGLNIDVNSVGPLVPNLASAPATLPLMLAGLAALGLGGRGQRRATKV